MTDDFERAATPPAAGQYQTPLSTQLPASAAAARGNNVDGTMTDYAIMVASQTVLRWKRYSHDRVFIISEAALARMIQEAVSEVERDMY